MGENNIGELLGRLKAPKQRRARQTRQAILEAARRRFDAEGFDRATIKDIAAEADVSVGAIYEHFNDKRTLLREVGHLEARRLRDDSFGAFHKALARAEREGAPLPRLEEVVRQAIRGTLESHRRYPRLLADLVDIAYRDQEFFAFVQEVSDEAVTFIMGLLVLFGARKAGSEARLSARLLVLLCESSIRKFALYGDALSEDELVEELTVLVMRYLFPEQMVQAQEG